MLVNFSLGEILKSYQPKKASFSNHFQSGFKLYKNCHYSYVGLSLPEETEKVDDTHMTNSAAKLLAHVELMKFKNS